MLIVLALIMSMLCFQGALADLNNAPSNKNKIILAEENVELVFNVVKYNYDKISTQKNVSKVSKNITTIQGEGSISCVGDKGKYGATMVSVTSIINRDTSIPMTYETLKSEFNLTCDIIEKYGDKDFRLFRLEDQTLSWSFYSETYFIMNKNNVNMDICFFDFSEYYTNELFAMARWRMEGKDTEDYVVIITDQLEVARLMDAMATPKFVSRILPRGYPWMWYNQIGAELIYRKGYGKYPKAVFGGSNTGKQNIDSYTEVCNANKVNIRVEPSMGAKSIAQINKGEGLIVLETNGEWSKIECKKGVGYIKNKYIDVK